MQTTESTIDDLRALLANYQEDAGDMLVRIRTLHHALAAVVLAVNTFEHTASGGNYQAVLIAAEDAKQVLEEVAP